MDAFTVPSLIVTLLSLLLASPVYAQQASESPQLQIDRIENVRSESGTVHFRYSDSTKKSPSPVSTGIIELFHLGAIMNSATELPYFLFSGYPCSDCKDSPNIYILRPDGRKPSSFIFPGKIVDPKDGAVLMQSRAFFGRCLRSTPSEAYVVFQQERVDRRRSLQSSVFIAEPGQDHLMERLLERRLPRIHETLKLVRQKACHEISGKNRTMLRKLLDLRPKRDPEKEEKAEGDDAETGARDSAEEDAPPKENQTDRDLSVPPKPET